MNMKKRLLYFTLVFSLLPLGLSAQETRLFRYQGEVDLAYSFGIDDETNNLNLEIVNGIRFSRYLYAGIGLGASGNFSDEAITFPIFVDVKGYMPVSDKMDLTAGVDIGTKLDYFYDTSGGLLFRPEFGLHFPVKRKTGIKLTLFYELYAHRIIVSNVQISAKTNQIGLKFGVSF